MPTRVLASNLEVVDFGECVSGQSVSRALRVRNSGDTVVDGFNVAIQAEELASFALTARDCGATLGAGEECQLTLSFTPQGAGLAAGVVILTGVDTSEVRVPLQGTGAVPGTLISTLSQLSFGEVEVGSATAPLEWPITNNGTLPTGRLTLSNTNPASFQATTDCGPPLAPGASCTVSVRFLAPVRSEPYEFLTLSDGTAEVTVNVVGSAAPRLTITPRGTGQLSIDAPVDCARGCTLLAPSFVTVRASTANGTNSFFSGWSISGTAPPECQGPSRECTVLIDTSQELVATFSQQVNNLVFTSSESYPSNLGGVSAYDAECNRLATAAGINDSAGTAFIAGLSGPTPFGDRMASATRGWVRMDGLPFGETRENLGDREWAPFYPVAFDESGVSGQGAIRTGEAATDGIMEASCEQWTSDAFEATNILGSRGSGPTWKVSFAAPCGPDFLLPVYCFGRRKTAPLVARNFSGKRLWLSRGTLAVGSRTPDAVCQADLPPGVTRARALIGYGNTAAASLLDETATYVRPDGALVGTGAQIRQMTLVGGPWVFSNGSSAIILDYAWTGGPVDRAPAATENCNDWQNPSGVGMIADSAATDIGAFVGNTLPCTFQARVYCIEI